jgi:hypothetical protein
VNPIELQKHLKGLNYSAIKEAVIKHVDKNGVDQEVRSILEQLTDEEYEAPTDVNKAVGEIE